jgi:hypothetical protein
LVQTEITAEQRRRAWQLAYRTSLEQLPDAEVEWEQAFWHRANFADLAEVCERVMDERRSWDLSLPGGARPEDLELLRARTPSGPVMLLIEHEALPLVSALRVVFHAWVSQ